MSFSEAVVNSRVVLICFHIFPVSIQSLMCVHFATRYLAELIHTGICIVLFHFVLFGGFLVGWLFFVDSLDLTA